MDNNDRRGSRVPWGGGGPKFEIMRAKYWYVMVTNSDVMRGGGGSVQGGVSPPPLSSAKCGSFDVLLNH